jgi:RNA polymerase sigma-70 factor (ECF subfamily)
MGPDRPPPEEAERLLDRVRAGDREALDRLLALHRDFLRRVVELRLDRRMRARVDASDVVQEAQLEAARRIDDYLQRRPMPFHVWLQKTAYENLLRIRRQHVEAGCRSVANEAPLPEASSLLLAQQLLGGGPTPSQEVRERELAQQLRQAVGRLSDEDREILLLRGFEGLTNEEAGHVLGVEAATASKRYTRSLRNLRKLLVAGGVGGPET